jgi:hypothetical protein
VASFKDAKSNHVIHENKVLKSETKLWGIMHRAEHHLGPVQLLSWCWQALRKLYDYANVTTLPTCLLAVAVAVMANANCARAVINFVSQLSRRKEVGTARPIFQLYPRFYDGFSLSTSKTYISTAMLPPTIGLSSLHTLPTSRFSNLLYSIPASLL